MRLTQTPWQLAALAAFLFVASTGSAGGAGGCTNEIKGTDGNDLLKGTAASDRMLGLPGNDTLSGEAGDDCLDGGTGSDRLTGGVGADRVLAGNDPDTVNGSDGADALDGQDGSDALAGEAGDDAIHGGPGDDDVHEVGDGYRPGEPLDVGSNQIDTGPGADRIEAANGRKDTIHCGSGKDRASVDRTDRLKSCEKRSFLISPFPQIAPKSGNRRRSFMISFRSLSTTDSRTEFFSITTKGPDGCKRSVTNSVGVTYHRNRVVRYLQRPFSGNGHKAKRWCRGRYRGSAAFVSIEKAGCKVKADRSPDPKCTSSRLIGEFTFRVR